MSIAFPPQLVLYKNNDKILTDCQIAEVKPSTLVMVTKATETFIAYFTSVHLLVHCISVNIPIMQGYVIY
jgi:hypothetical protein